MTTTKFKGTPVHIDGEFIRAGVQAPDFELVRGDLSPLKLSDLKGKRVVLNIFPSLDTGVCATSVRKFNKLASSLPDTVVVAVSKDLPFAQSPVLHDRGHRQRRSRVGFPCCGFCRRLWRADGRRPLAGIARRAVVVIDKAGKVVYTQLVPEITEEPDYDAAVEAVKAL